MAVMVVGGNGYIGVHVLREVIKRGETPVSYDIQPPSEEMNDILEKVKIIRGDVLNVAELISVIKENRIDRIIHMASLLTSASQQDPVKAYHLNTGSTLNVLEAARITDVQRIAYSSSIAVYGRTSGNPISEDHPKEPISVYGVTKLFCEHLGATYRETYGIGFVAVRWPVVWGPGQGKKIGKSPVHGAGKFADIIEKPARGEGVTISGGSQEYELIYVKDAARSIVLALFAERLKHYVFNAGCESMVTLQSLAEMIKKYIPDASITIEEGFDYAVPCQGYIDISLAKIELGYEPWFRPLEAVKDYINHLVLKPRKEDT
jgi:UDP-glucose 4-epimerase